MKRIWIYTGPSCCGKSTYVDSYCKLLYKIKTTTTRLPRDDDKKDDYEYVSDDEFFDMMDKDLFFIVNNVYGKLCGVRKEEIGKSNYSIVILDVHGALKLKEKLNDRDDIKAISIFVLPKWTRDVDELHNTVFKRLKSRGTHSEQDISNRLKELPLEYSMRDKFDEIIYV